MTDHRVSPSRQVCSPTIGTTSIVVVGERVRNNFLFPVTKQRNIATGHGPRTSGKLDSSRRGRSGHNHTNRKKARSQSLPPLRYSPQIRHTHGRLHEDYNETLKRAKLATTAAVAKAFMLLLSSTSRIQPNGTRPIDNPWPISKAHNRRRLKCIRIDYSDERLRRKQESKLEQLLGCAKNDPQTSTRALLAKKALRYRCVLSPEQLSDLRGLAIEETAAKCNRIKWRKVVRAS